MRSDAKKQQLTLLAVILLIGGGWIGVGAVTGDDTPESNAQVYAFFEHFLISHPDLKP